MTAIARRPRRNAAARLFDELSRHAKVAAPLLAEFERESGATGGASAARLGRLYEAKLARQKSSQRATGSFYTPDYLVDFIVAHTLAPLVAGRNLRDICKLRILDPSCGGGAFLLGALRYLEAHCVSEGHAPGPALRRRLCRTLVGVDLDPGAVAITRAALHLAVGGRTPLRDLQLQHGDALLPETEVGAIDAIVGNPPWGQKGLHLSAPARARYKELFVTATGVWDPFKLFVERCHQLLTAGGRWGLVLPDIVLLKNLQCVRDVILEGSAIEHIAHCGQAFAGANIDAVAIVANREFAPVPKRHELDVWPHLRADWQTSSPARHRQRQALFQELPGHKFNLYLHGPALAFYRRLVPHPRLGERVEMHEGVHSGNIRAKLFVDQKRNAHCHELVLGGRELAAYQLRWAGRFIDTHPGVIDKSAGDYANLGRSQWHKARKIVVRRTGDRVIAAYDDAGYYVSNNMFVLTPGEDMQERDCRALVAVLNSQLMTWYFRAVQPRAGRLFAELKLVHLRDFPLPTPESWRRHVDELASLCEQASAKGTSALAARIDALVESAFEISPAERELIKLAQ